MRRRPSVRGVLLRSQLVASARYLQQSLTVQACPRRKPGFPFGFSQGASIQRFQADPEDQFVRMEKKQTKSGETRIVPLPGVLVNLLTEATPKIGKVFSDTTSAQNGTRLAPHVVWEPAKSLTGETYTWPRHRGLMAHDLRQSGERNLPRAGVAETVAENCGPQDATRLGAI